MKTQNKSGEPAPSCQHTLGEWVIDLESPMTLGGDYRPVEALTPDGKFVAREICSMPFDTDDYPDGRNYLEDVANARLVIAAPKLLAACKRVSSWLDLPQETDREKLEQELAEAIRDCQAAVNKAMGVQS